MEDITSENPTTTTVTTDSGEIQFLLNEVEKIQEPEVQDEGTKVEQEKDDKNLCNGFPVSDMPKAIIQGLSTQYSNVQVKIVEQPAPNKVRFR